MDPSRRALAEASEGAERGSISRRPWMAIGAESVQLSGLVVFREAPLP